MITGALWKVGPGVRFGLNWNAKCQIEWEVKRRIVRRRQAALSFHSSPKWMLFLYTSKRKENHTWYKIQINLLGEGVGWKWKGGQGERGQPGVEIAEDCLLRSLVKGRLALWSTGCLVGWLFGWLFPCRKWPNTLENGCWLPPSDHIHSWNLFLDQTRPDQEILLKKWPYTAHRAVVRSVSSK